MPHRRPNQFPAQTNIILTDALGRILATFSNTANSADLLGNQVYGPYGSQNYQSGSMGTNKGFTGHYADATGLDYYNARYYDPVAGVFLSADSVQGNVQGMNPYGYVQGNPETKSDPTGKHVVCGDTCGGKPTPPPLPPPPPTTPPPPVTLSDNGLRLCQLNGGCGQRIQRFDRPTLVMLCDIDPACRKWESGQSFGASVMFVAGIGTVIVAGAELVTFGTGLLALYGLAGHPEEDQALLSDLTTSSEEMATAYQQEEESLTQELEGNGVLSGACSFLPQTLVATTHGEQPIGKLHVGDKVWAYNSTTRKMELEPVLHVWIHQDNDLVDLTLATTTTVLHGSRTTTSTTREVIHTNKKHPFYTIERGFLSVSHITLGMHLLRADGRMGVVTGWKVVPGAKVMYNLEVQQDHTFTVGVGQWVVHNFCGNDINFEPSVTASKYMKHAADFGITDTYNPTNAAQFQQTIRDFVDAPNTQTIVGTYRGTPVTHFFDPTTHLDVMVDANNNFISGWRLSDMQVNYLLGTGNVQ